jgi:hypothetical protein
MHLQVCEGEEKGGNTHARSLASPRRVGRGVAWRGEARRGARAHDVCVNSPPKSGPNPCRPTTSFYHLFCYEPVSNTFDRDRPSRLLDAVTLGRSSLYIRAAALEIGIDQQPRKHQHI